MSLAGPFLFDPRAFWEDEDVQLLSWEGVGVYLRLLSRQWEEGSIPRDLRRLRSGLAGGERLPVSEELILELLDLFFDENGDDRWINRRLAVERIAWVKKKKALSKAGRKGGLRSGEARLKPGLSQAEARLKPGSSSTSSSSLSSSSDEEKNEEPPPPPKGGEQVSRKRKGRRVPPVKIPDELFAIGLGPESFSRRVAGMVKTKPATAWQQELDRLAPLVAEVGAAVVLETWEDASASGWQGCTPKMVREAAAKAAKSNGGRSTTTDYEEGRPGQVDGYLLRKEHLECQRSFPEEERDSDWQDEDLDRFEESIRLELDAINASPELKQELRAKLAA
jgi:uncharacterized protein YdaU (DUF1376 family)